MRFGEPRKYAMILPICPVVRREFRAINWICLNQGTGLLSFDPNKRLIGIPVGIYIRTLLENFIPKSRARHTHLLEERNHRRTC